MSDTLCKREKNDVQYLHTHWGSGKASHLCVLPILNYKRLKRPQGSFSLPSRPPVFPSSSTPYKDLQKPEFLFPKASHRKVSLSLLHGRPDFQEEGILQSTTKKNLNREALAGPPQSKTSRSQPFVQAHFHRAL